MKKALVITDEIEDSRAAVSKPVLPFAWRWVIVICSLLGLSGGIRYWRDWQFQSLEKQSEIAPFPLREIPDALGNWHAIQGVKETLEPEIARIAGAKDHIIRTYVDEKTGQTASVLVLYGLAHVVWAHTPDACYPATGFKAVSPSRDQDVDVQIPDRSTVVRFRLQHFVKSKAGQTDYREVYSSFRNAGQWGVNMAQNWKSFRYHPGMFKVQIQCQAASSNKIDETNVQELLSLIVREIERRMAHGG